MEISRVTSLSDLMPVLMMGLHSTESQRGKGAHWGSPWRSAFQSTEFRKEASGTGGTNGNYPAQNYYLVWILEPFLSNWFSSPQIWEVFWKRVWPTYHSSSSTVIYSNRLTDLQSPLPPKHLSFWVAFFQLAHYSSSIKVFSVQLKKSSSLKRTKTD